MPLSSVAHRNRAARNQPELAYSKTIDDSIDQKSGAKTKDNLTVKRADLLRQSLLATINKTDSANNLHSNTQAITI